MNAGTDKLDVSGFGFGGAMVMGSTATLVTTADAATASNPGSGGYFIFDDTGPDQSTVYWDATGGSGADAMALATLTGVITLQPQDFHLI